MSGDSVPDWLTAATVVWRAVSRWVPCHWCNRSCIGCGSSEGLASALQIVGAAVRAGLFQWALDTAALQ